MSLLEAGDRIRCFRLGFVPGISSQTTGPTLHGVVFPSTGCLFLYVMKKVNPYTIDRFQKSFDGGRFIACVDALDEIRDRLYDGEMRTKLNTLYELASEASDGGDVRETTPSIWELAAELETDVFEIYDTAEKLHDLRQMLEVMMNLDPEHEQYDEQGRFLGQDGKPVEEEG